MKRNTIFLITLFISCLLVSGCQKPNQNDEPAPPPIVSEEENPLFKPGVWMAKGGEFGQFYFFDTDGVSGRSESYENGIGLGFTYEQSRDKTIFHMGDIVSSLPCKVIVTDDTHITLDWEAQYSEELTFLSELDSEHFHFYTNEELCQLALKYYTSRNDTDEKDLSAAAIDNGDGTAMIQIYQNLSDHNSTAALYQIDRCTGEGKDVNNDTPIDLTNGSPDMDISYLNSPVTTQEYYEFIADTSEYSFFLLLWPEVPVTNFRLVSLEFSDDSDSDISFRMIDELFSVDTLTPEKPLTVRLAIPDTIPNTGITYIDRNGEEKLYAISMSGLDGSLFLMEVTIDIS